MNAQVKGLQKQLAVRKIRDLQEQSAFDARLAKQQ